MGLSKSDGKTQTKGLIRSYKNFMKKYMRNYRKYNQRSLTAVQLNNYSKN
jgi:hypothetical protein